MKWLCAFVAGAIACAGFAEGTESLVLSRRDAPTGRVIVLPEKASASQRYAAEELRDHVAKMTGETLAIATDADPLPPAAILLGETRYTEETLGAKPDFEALGTDGFRLVSRPPHLLVVASPVRGTLYGVYELLETYGGCGWYASWHTVIPTCDAFAVPGDLDVTETPAIRLRMPYWRDVKGDFAARIRANGGFQAVGAKHGGVAFGFGGGIGVCHTFNILMPPKEHFAEHPEYFSYRRKQGKRIGEATQLCLTNPDVLRLVTSNVLARIRSDPSQLCYGVSQNDNVNYCECDSCAAVDAEEESHAGTMIRFVNAIAEAVEREFPGKIVETLAYEYTRNPPKKTRLRPNVMPCLCTSGCGFGVPIAESRDEGTRSFLDDITRWGEQTRQLYIWDYTVNFRHYPHLFPNVYALQGNLRLFRDNHVIGYLAQGDFTGWHASFGELKAWLISKWAWNPDQPAEPLIDRFFRGYYGKAAPLVRKWFDEIYAEVRAQPDADPLIMYCDIRRAPPSDDVIQRGAQMWRQAAEIVRTSDPACFYNVAMGAADVNYSLAMRPVYPRTRTNPKTKTPDPLLFLTRDEALRAQFLKAKAAARRVVKAMELAGKHGHRFVLNEHWNNEWVGIVKATATRVDPARDVLELPATYFKRSNSNECVLVEGAGEKEGPAVRLANTHWNWCTFFRLGQVQFDEGAPIRVRIRVRVDKTGLAPQGQAFSAGVYDPEKKEDFGKIVIKASEAGDGWAWYDVATLVPRPAAYLWIAPGRFDRNAAANPSVDEVYIDRLELIDTRQ